MAATRRSRPRLTASIQLPNYRNPCQTQCVRYLRLAQARSIIFERQFRLSLIELEFAKAISVREFAQIAQLLGIERGLECVADFEKRHAGSIAGLSRWDRKVGSRRFDTR